MIKMSLLGLQNFANIGRFLFAVDRTENKLRLYTSRYNEFDIWSMQLYEPFEKGLNITTVGSPTGLVVSKGVVFLYVHDKEGKIYRVIVTYEFDKKNDLIFKTEVENWTQASSCPLLPKPDENMIFPYRAQRISNVCTNR